VQPSVVAAEQHDVRRQNDRSEADAELLLAARRILEPHGFPHVRCQQDDEQQREIEEEPVHVLEHERERRLAAVAHSRFSDGARRWIGSEAL
jgi:hypothetical protein